MFLDKILSYKYMEIKRRKEGKPLNTLKKELQLASEIRPFNDVFMKQGINIIGEIKKASPSKGILCENFNPVSLAIEYEKAGAVAISVLTDEKFFHGGLLFLSQVKEKTIKTPILCKDFIIDPYQITEARIMGADAILLIVAALGEDKLKEFIDEAKHMGLTPLVEVHDREELELAIRSGAEVIGINNRNLHTFTVDLNITFELMKSIPPEIIVITESGIKDYREIIELSRAGVRGFLIGETIVKSSAPGEKIRELIGI